MVVTAKIEKLEDGKLVLKPDTDISRFVEQKRPRRVEVRLDDGRTISVDQRRKIFAIIRDISLWSGHEPEELRQYLEWDFCSRAMREWFSLSDCDMTTAREFITYLISFCFHWGVPTKDSLLTQTDDIGKYLYLCLENRRCAICNRPAEVHHVDRIGMDDIANKLGGYDKLLKLVAMSAAALFIALNADKITGFLSGILKLLGGINRETILAAAKWLALFLIIEDIWTFLQGGDSVIGRLLKDAGVDVDYLRETILNFFQDIRDFGENAISKISAFWNDHKEQAQAVFDFLWTGFSDLLHDFLLLVTHISDLISGIITGFQTGDWTQFLNALKQLGLDFVDSLIGIFENLKSLATIIFKKLPQPLQDAFQSVWDWLNGFFGWFGEKIQWIKGLWGDVKSFFLGTGSSTDEDDFGGSSGGTVNEKSDASENNEKPDNKSNFSEEKTGRKSDNSGKTEKSEEKSSSHRSEKSGDRSDPQKQEKNKDKSGNKSDSQNHERAKDKSGSYRLGKTAKSKAVSSNTDRAGSSSSNNKNVPYLNRQNGVALMKNQAWTGGTGVTVKTIKSSPVNNNTKNVSVRQENNQKYTFHVDSTTAADKLRSEVSTQSTQSADGLARMINYGR